MELIELMKQELDNLIRDLDIATVVAAVSGGSDSIVLLHLLAALRQTFGYGLVVVHVHHGIRGESADRDAEFVKSVAEALGCPFEQSNVQVLKEVQATGESVETAARRLRYTSLAEVASRYGRPIVMTAHHLDDQAETVLDRLLRGAGLQGLAGMAPLRRLFGVPVARPLLAVEKGRLLDYAKEHNVAFFEDETNTSLRFRRNRIRHELLPYLKNSFNPRIVGTLAQEAEVIRAENDYMDQMAKEFLAHFVKLAQHQVECECEKFVHLPLALQRRVVKLVLEYLGSHLHLGFEEIEGVRRLFLQGQGKWTLKGGLLLVVQNGILRMIEGDSIREYAQGMQWTPTDVDRASFFSIRGLKWIVKISEKPLPCEFPRSLWEMWIALGDGEKLTIRGWQSGDRILPLGMAGSKLLSDVFIDKKVPREWRQIYPVFTVGQDIVWVPGLVRSRMRLVGKDMPRAVRILVWPAMED